jgi:hypothetical protein
MRHTVQTAISRMPQPARRSDMSNVNELVEPYLVAWN